MARRATELLELRGPPCPQYHLQNRCHKLSFRLPGVLESCIALSTQKYKMLPVQESDDLHYLNKSAPRNQKFRSGSRDPDQLDHDVFLPCIPEYYLTPRSNLHS